MKLRIIIIGAIILRLILAVTTYHPDLSAFILSGKIIILEKAWLSFYDATLPNHIVFNYPPLAYLIPSIFYLPFIGVVKNTALGLINIQPETSFYLPLLIYKLPMILSDIGIILLIPKLFTKKKNRQLSQLLWALNPIAIYVSSMMGQVDIIIAFLLTLALVNLKSKKIITASFLIGLSALIKPIGLILIPLIFIYHYQQTKKILIAASSLAAGFGIYLLGIAPYLHSPSFRYYALIADQTTKSSFAGITIASGHVIPWFFISYLTIAYLLWQKRFGIKAALGGAVLSSLVFSHFHPQWLIWVMPIILYLSIIKKQIIIWMFVLFAWFTIVFSFDSSLHLGIFLPFNLNFEPALAFPQYTLFLSLARSGLIVLLLSLVI